MIAAVQADPTLVPRGSGVETFAVTELWIRYVSASDVFEFGYAQLNADGVQTGTPPTTDVPSDGSWVRVPCFYFGPPFVSHTNVEVDNIVAMTTIAFSGVSIVDSLVNGAPRQIRRIEYPQPTGGDDGIATVPAQRRPQSLRERLRLRGRRRLGLGPQPRLRGS